MTNFQDLSAELVLAIGSHIPMSVEKRPLTLVNRKLALLINPQLYRHIVLDETGDSSLQGNLEQIFESSCSDSSRLGRLCRELKKRSPSKRPFVESLDLQAESTTLYMPAMFSDVTLYLPSLKSLCLRGKIPAGHIGGRKKSRTMLEQFKIVQRLRGVSETLESLIIDIEQDLRDTKGTGCFTSFKALKHLGIQSHIMIGERDDLLTINDFDDHQFNPNATLLPLPKRLQKLQLACWTDGYEVEERYWGRVTAILLRNFMKWSLDQWPELQDFTVYYPTKYDVDMEDAATMGQKKQSLSEDRLVFQQYAAQGQWQKVAGVLTKLGGERNISVRFVQGSPEGSRAWGETATEPANAAS